jgi:hypothetical protein
VLFGRSKKKKKTESDSYYERLNQSNANLDRKMKAVMEEMNHAAKKADEDMARLTRDSKRSAEDIKAMMAKVRTSGMTYGTGGGLIPAGSYLSKPGPPAPGGAVTRPPSPTPTYAYNPTDHGFVWFEWLGDPSSGAAVKMWECLGCYTISVKPKEHRAYCSGEDS